MRALHLVFLLLLWINIGTCLEQMMISSSQLIGPETFDDAMLQYFHIIETFFKCSSTNIKKILEGFYNLKNGTQGLENISTILNNSAIQYGKLAQQLQVPFNLISEIRQASPTWTTFQQENFKSMYGALKKQAATCDVIKSHFNDISRGITKWKNDRKYIETNGTIEIHRNILRNLAFLTDNLVVTTQIMFPLITETINSMANVQQQITMTTILFAEGSDSYPRSTLGTFLQEFLHDISSFNRETKKSLKKLVKEIDSCNNKFKHFVELCLMDNKDTHVKIVMSNEILDDIQNLEDFFHRASEAVLDVEKLFAT